MPSLSGTTALAHRAHCPAATRCGTARPPLRWPDWSGSGRQPGARGGRRGSHADRFRDAPDPRPGHPGRRACQGSTTSRRRGPDRRSAPNRSPSPTPSPLTAAGLAIVSNYQYGKPVGPRRPTSRAVTPAASPTRGPHGRCTPQRAAARAHPSSSRSTTTSTATPGTVLRCNGFGASTRYSECSAPASTRVSIRVSGPSTTGSSGRPARPAAGGLGRPGRVTGQIHPAAVLYQRIVATASTPGPLVGGLESRRQRCAGPGRRAVEPASMSHAAWVRGCSTARRNGWPDITTAPAMSRSRGFTADISTGDASRCTERTTNGAPSPARNCSPPPSRLDSLLRPRGR